MRRVKRHKLPKGKLKYILKLRTGEKYVGNKKQAEKIIEMLKNSNIYFSVEKYEMRIRRNPGRSGLKFKKNSGKITRIYLENISEVLMVKISFPEYIEEIYEIIVEELENFY